MKTALRYRIYIRFYYKLKNLQLKLFYVNINNVNINNVIFNEWSIDNINKRKITHN